MPHNVWDHDAQAPSVMVDTQWRGQPRKLLRHADRNGFFYVFDRINGERLLTKALVHNLTWAKEIGTNGRPVVNPNQEPLQKEPAYALPSTAPPIGIRQPSIHRTVSTTCRR
jgi:glucose dehydrogenase